MILPYNDAVCRSPFSALKASLGIAENASRRPSSPAANTSRHHTKHGLRPNRLGAASVCSSGPHGFERIVALAVDDDPAVIADRVRETLEG
jgi:hypothetical protein